MGLFGFVECIQLLSSKVRLPKLKSIAIIGTTLKSPDWINDTVDNCRLSFVGAFKEISLGLNELFVNTDPFDSSSSIYAVKFIFCGV